MTNSDWLNAIAYQAKRLLDAPHPDHFASRLGDEELEAVEAIKLLFQEEVVDDRPPQVRELIFAALDEERRRQEMLKTKGRFSYTCADSEPTLTDKAAILGEEYGELCGAVVQASRLSSDRTQADLKKELVHVGAVAVAWLEAMLLMEPTPTEAP